MAILCAGCGPSKIYVDTDSVPGIGGIVRFPSGEITPIGVKRVVDGETLLLTNKETVRYIGVYIPDIYNIPKRAKDLNESLAHSDEMRFEFDVRQRDEKGNLLAYAYLPDGRMINIELVRQGLAQSLIIPPNEKYGAKFKQAQAEAQKNKLGIWQE